MTYKFPPQQKSLFQCLAILLVKKFFPISNPNFSGWSLRWFPLVLLLVPGKPWGSWCFRGLSLHANLISRVNSFQKRAVSFGWDVGAVNWLHFYSHACPALL